MGDFKRKASFENAFKKAVTNFDETRIWFEHPGKMYNESKICFVLNGKLEKLPMYKTSYHINIWKNYFIEFLNTNNFDMNGYWKLYDDSLIDKKDIDKIYKFTLCIKFGNNFYPNSEEMGKFLDNYRKKYPKCGIKQVSKTLDVK